MASPAELRSPAPPRSAVATEVAAGLTTFFTMAYIVVVNPRILASPGTGMPLSGVLTGTVLLCFSMTLLMGLYARLPFAVAPGMGINAFFAYTIVQRDGVAWPVALGLVFWAGVLFLVVSVTRLREAIATAIPPSLRAATAAGIGILLAFVGLRNAGILVADPVTLVGPGQLDHRAGLTLLGLAVTTWLAHRGRSLAYLSGIFVVAAVAWMVGLVPPPQSVFAAPDFSSTFLRLDLWRALDASLVPAMLAIMFTDLFDSLATFIGVAQASRLLGPDGQPRNLRQGLIVDALATLGAGLVGTSPGTAYVESIAGIRAGGRTGLTAVVTALCFLPCFFVAPLVEAVPPYATTAVLLLVGAAMVEPVTTLSFVALEDAVPAFATLVLIPLTLSITQGILWGFILHAGLYLLVGRGREVTPTMYALAAVAAGLLLVERGF